jgi:starch synthase (maltosyl-transferring)
MPIQRVVVEAVTPEVDGGRTPVKRVQGDRVVVEADVFADGHDRVAAELRVRRPGAGVWEAVPMLPVGEDRFRGAFTVEELGEYRYQPTGWIDAFATWRDDLEKRRAAGLDLGVDLAEGAVLVAAASRRAKGRDRTRLNGWAAVLAGGGGPAQELAASSELAAMMGRYPDRAEAGLYPVELALLAERPRARTGAWYEVFPRSWAPGRHGTLADLAERLPYIADMGFDVLYLTPIHPIGHTARKGRNNAPAAGPGDPGSPWAIGSEAGGHTAIHPELGTLEDFRALIRRASELGLEVAMDLALQCSPDHPYVRGHPEWFRHRPDGSIRCAENPPKRYEDIYPLDFGCEAREALWAEIRAVLTFWMGEGIRIFRVDNPHTKPFAFWGWLIGEAKAEHPDVVFLAEAFTRPKVMRRLAKVGFSQSYTYFAWRNGAEELAAYMTELTQGQSAEYLRPSLWPNTPDILTEYLQTGGRPAFAARLVLAATLAASYGIYGPAFELCEDRALRPGSEEYLDSEKYELRTWDLSAPGLQPLIARVNRIRREHPCLQVNTGLAFHPTGNDRLIAYTRRAGDDVLLVVVSLNPFGSEHGLVELPLAELGVDPGAPYQVHDLLSDARYIWQGRQGYVALDPQVMPAHIFQIRRRLRREDAFDYYA